VKAAMKLLGFGQRGVIAGLVVQPLGDGPQPVIARLRQLQRLLGGREHRRMTGHQPGQGGRQEEDPHIGLAVGAVVVREPGGRQPPVHSSGRPPARGLAGPGKLAANGHSPAS
jgi:hypothetical protein